MTIHDAALWSAYLATSYVAAVDGVELELRVGQRAPALDAVLDAAGAIGWCFVTAFNPGSDPLDEASNRVRNVELRRWIDEAGFVAYEGEGRGDDGEWPPEASYLVVGPTKLEAIAFGRRAGQRAVVFGERGERAELIDCGAASDAHG